MRGETSGSPKFPWNLICPFAHVLRPRPASRFWPMWNVGAIPLFPKLHEQPRHQLSDAILKAEVLDSRVEACIGHTVVCDPRFVAIGFSDEEEVENGLGKKLKETPLVIDSIEPGENPGIFNVNTRGSFVLQTKFRQIHEASPPSAFSRSFYLGETREVQHVNLTELVFPSLELTLIIEGFRKKSLISIDISITWNKGE